MLRHYRLTPSQYADLPESDQVWLYGYELYRRRQLAEWRAALVGEDPDKSHYTPEAATLLMIADL